ncbi:energy transducer TonB [uncultured Alistipes sp.]|jgi:tonB family C-terminal domain|uniref:energy transducer TonB n=1 Tax=uncultured Alistipes sp. TaxID=538949 RepID=UPI0025E5D745|nr:energy transducer TonB [uncultured Alistipes sp.]
MKEKKSFKADLRNKRSLFLEIGLVAALSLVIVAFNHTPEFRTKSVVQNSGPVVVEELPPPTQDTPKQQNQKVAVAILSSLIEIIDNDKHFQTEIPSSELTEFDIVEPIVMAKVEDIDDDGIFLTAETMPKFQNGDLNAFRTWVMQNVKFPQAMLEASIGGRVVLSFVIDKDGRLTNIEVLQSPDRMLSEEAIRVLNKSPKWSPGLQRNQAVKVKYTLPVDFRIQN